MKAIKPMKKIARKQAIDEKKQQLGCKWKTYKHSNFKQKIPKEENTIILKQQVGNKHGSRMKKQ